MQQHSQVIELKDRLVEALDEQLNVKDINEVNRIISILEQINVTREDLEKTRLGKYINDLRKKTDDKELAKRAKSLIKRWREQAIGISGAVNNVSTLTSPFNSNSISPHGFINGYSEHRNSLNDAKLTSPGSHHPALLRLKNQFCSLPANSEKLKSVGPLSPVSQKLSVLFRPNAQTASPKDEVTNGYDKLSHQKQVPATNGLSPAINKNFVKDTGISPNAYRRRTSPNSNTTSGNNTPLINPSSAASSRHCSPVAFAFSNDSRDSFNNKNSYSSQHKAYDFHDEDSNSSQFSNLSNDCSGYTTKSTEKKTRTKKRKNVDETDSLRENLIYVNYGSRAPKSTKELIVKFNIQGDTKNVKNDELHKPFSSLSASSSPSISLAKNGENYFVKRNGFHSEDNSLDSFDSNFLQKKCSPSLLINDHENSPSPSAKSCDSYIGEKYSSDGEIDTNIHENIDVNVSVGNVSKIDQEIKDIYSKLPKISEEDISLMKDFEFDVYNIYDSYVETICNTGDTINTNKNLESEFNSEDDEYETFEYEEEYEEEIDEEMDIDENDDKNLLNNSNDQMSFYHNNNNKCDISNCDINNVEQNINNSEKSMEISGNDDHYPPSKAQHNHVAISNSHAENESVIIADNDNLNSHKTSINTLNNKNDIQEEESMVEQQPTEVNDAETNAPPSMVSLNEEESKRKLFVKKKRKCIKQSFIKKSSVDRLANDQWESFNGNYDKDNVWHDYSEMTSSYILTGGENVNNKNEENVLHILPYVNCNW